MKKYAIANWKSNKDQASAGAWLQEFERAIIHIPPDQVTVVLAPPTPLLGVVQQTIAESSTTAVGQLALGIQDISPFAAGSYTGAVSTTNLAGFPIQFAIVGHSERRRHFHETHQEVANKVARCVEAGITPVVCVDDEYIADQAAAISREHLSSCIVAYEELGAIGTGNNEPVTKVAEVVQRIKVVFDDVPVLYGGSVKPDNVAQYIPICDGVLVGGASLDAKAFAAIITSIAVV